MSALALRGAPYGAMMMRRAIFPAIRNYRRYEGMARASYAAGRKIYGAYRRYRRYARKRTRSTPSRAAKRMKIGENVGRANSKRYLVLNNASVNYDTRTLYEVNLCLIPRADDNNDINKRQREIVNMRGFKICMEMKSQTTSLPLHVNVAVIAPKDNSGTIPIEDFFRGDGQTRGVNFNNGLTANDFRCRAINTDLYTVLKHKRILLNNQGTATTQQWGSQYRTLDFYIKLNRQLRYDTGTEGRPAHGNVFLVWWCDIFGTGGSSPPQEEQLLISKRIVSYWRETS